MFGRASEFRFFSDLLAQNVVSAFMSVYWKGVAEEYAGFRSDVLSSLSLCLMSDSLWFDHEEEATGEAYPKASFLAWLDDAGRVRLDWHAGKANQNLSAMLFFCLKYLPAGEISGWADSLLAVRDPYWRGALAVWLEEAFGTGLLCFLMFPEEPRRALQRAATTSGDSDSIACLAGAFAGARLGMESWPRGVG